MSEVKKKHYYDANAFHKSNVAGLKAGCGCVIVSILGWSLLSPFDVPDVGLTLEHGCHLFHPGVLSNCVPPLHVTQ